MGLEVSAVGGADSVTARFAAGAATTVRAEALLFNEFGSAVAVVALAEFVTDPGNVGAVITSVNVPLAPLASVAMLAVTVPVPPTAGVVSVQPGDAVIEVKVVPAGRGSLIETFAAGSGPLFVTVMVYVMAPEVRTFAGPVFVTTRSATGRTVIVAEAVLPVPWLDVMALVTLFFTPEDVPVTSTDKKHNALDGGVPLERLTLFDPGTAVKVPKQNWLVAAGTAATTRPAGRMSVKAALLLGVVASRVIVNLRVVVPPTRIDASSKALEMDSGAANAW
jgi:hypothetical protein